MVQAQPGEDRAAAPQQHEQRSRGEGAPDGFVQRHEFSPVSERQQAPARANADPIGSRPERYQRLVISRAARKESAAESRPVRQAAVRQVGTSATGRRADGHRAGRWSSRSGRLRWASSDSPKWVGPGWGLGEVRRSPPGRQLPFGGGGSASDRCRVRTCRNGAIGPRGCRRSRGSVSGRGSAVCPGGWRGTGRASVGRWGRAGCTAGRGRVRCAP
ncbi:hypothetical protein D9M68_772250 [compost metagenome]